MKHQDGIDELMKELSIDIPDEDLVQITNKWLDKGNASLQSVRKNSNKSKSYYLHGTDLQENQRQVIDNKIHQSIETIIPIATSGVPVPNILAASEKTEALDRATMWEKVLQSVYRRQKIQKKMEKALRYLNIANFVVFKYRFNPETFDVETSVIHPDRCIFDNDRNIDDGFNWFAEKITVDAEELVKRFPKKEKEIKAFVQNKMGTVLTYEEIWTDELQIAKVKNILLAKQKNPNFDYKNEKGNYFDKPKIPYLPVNMFDMGETISGATSLIEQSIPLQDTLNKRKSQIDKNAQIVNGKVVGTGANGLSKQEFSEIDWTNPGEGIFMSEGEVGDIIRVSGSPLPVFVENDMHDSRNQIDNLMGTHSTTRGEREGRETATGRSILSQADRGRIDIFSRRLEEVVELLFKGWTQIIKVYFTGKKVISFVQESKIKERIIFDQKSIDSGMDIEIIPGTLLPKDSVSRQQAALTLANAQMISIVDLYREMGFKSPSEMAKRWVLQQQGNFQELIPGFGQPAGEGDVENQILKAEDENKRMAAGEPQPPFEGADANHLAVHEQFISQNELSPEVKQLFIDHMQAEVKIVEERSNNTI